VEVNSIIIKKIIRLVNQFVDLLEGVGVTELILANCLHWRGK